MVEETLVSDDLYKRTVLSLLCRVIELHPQNTVFDKVKARTWGELKKRIIDLSEPIVSVPNDVVSRLILDEAKLLNEDSFITKKEWNILMDLVSAKATANGIQFKPLPFNSNGYNVNEVIACAAKHLQLKVGSKIYLIFNKTETDIILDLVASYQDSLYTLETHVRQVSNVKGNLVWDDRGINVDDAAIADTEIYHAF